MVTANLGPNFKAKCDLRKVWIWFYRNNWHPTKNETKVLQVWMIKKIWSACEDQDIDCQFEETNLKYGH